MKAYRGPRHHHQAIVGDDVLTDRETQTILAGFLQARGACGATKPELARVLDLAKTLKVDGKLFALLARGRVRVRGIKKGELLFEQTPDDVDTSVDTTSHGHPHESANGAGGREERN